MKHIGHVDGATQSPLSWRTHSLGMLSPHDLFIPTPGERENIDADRYRHIGWVNPEADGGTIWANRADADKDTRPAYVVRVDAVTQPQPVFQDGPHVLNAGPTVVYNGFKTDPMDVLRSEFEALQKDVAALAKIIVDLTRQPPLDGLTGTEYNDLRKSVQTLEVKFQTLARIQQHGSIMDPPMTFYDHAFIAAWAALGGSYSEDDTVRHAHRIADHLTRDRVNRT